MAACGDSAAPFSDLAPNAAPVLGETSDLDARPSNSAGLDPDAFAPPDRFASRFIDGWYLFRTIGGDGDDGVETSATSDASPLSMLTLRAHSAIVSSSS